MEHKNINDLTAIAFQEDTRVLAAFAAVPTPMDGQPFPLDIITALEKLDWKVLLNIAFKKILNAQQSDEFLDTLENLCDEKQSNEMMSFISSRFSSKQFPFAENMIHQNSRGRFLKMNKTVPQDMINKSIIDKLLDR